MSKRKVPSPTIQTRSGKKQKGDEEIMEAEQLTECFSKLNEQMASSLEKATRALAKTTETQLRSMEERTTETMQSSVRNVEERQNKAQSQMEAVIRRVEALERQYNGGDRQKRGGVSEVGFLAPLGKQTERSKQSFQRTYRESSESIINKMEKEAYLRARRSLVIHPVRLGEDTIESAREWFRDGLKLTSRQANSLRITDVITHTIRYEGKEVAAEVTFANARDRDTIKAECRNLPPTHTARMAVPDNMRAEHSFFKDLEFFLRWKDGVRGGMRTAMKTEMRFNDREERLELAVTEKGMTGPWEKVKLPPKSLLTTEHAREKAKEILHKRESQGTGHGTDGDNISAGFSGSRDEVVVTTLEAGNVSGGGEKEARSRARVCPRRTEDAGEEEDEESFGNSALARKVRRSPSPTSSPEKGRKK